MTRARKRSPLVLAAVAAVLALGLLAPRPGAAVSTDDCHQKCSQEQRTCMYKCAGISDEGDNKACAADCVKKYKVCTKPCKRR